MIFIWLGLIVTLTLIELLTKQVVTVWYIVSAIVSLILSFFIDNYLIEFLVFVILGTILLFTTRDYLIKLVHDIKVKKIVGMTAIVTKEITKNTRGQVKIKFKKYSAISNKKIKTNTKVKVIDIEQDTLKVEKI